MHSLKLHNNSEVAAEDVPEDDMIDEVLIWLFWWIKRYKWPQITLVPAQLLFCCSLLLCVLQRIDVSLTHKPPIAIFFLQIVYHWLLFSHPRLCLSVSMTCTESPNSRTGRWLVCSVFISMSLLGCAGRTEPVCWRHSCHWGHGQVGGASSPWPHSFCHFLCYCRHILDTPTSEQHFMEQLHELDHKLNFAKLQQFKDTAAIADVKDVLERLKIKVWLCNVWS